MLTRAPPDHQFFSTPVLQYSNRPLSRSKPAGNARPVGTTRRSPAAAQYPCGATPPTAEAGRCG